MKEVVLAAVAALALGGCGGGGGGGDSLSISMPQTPLRASLRPVDLPEWVAAEATVKGRTSVPELYVVIVDSGATFASSTGGIEELGGDQYQTLLITRDDLPPGLRTGSVRVRLCADAGCGRVLAEASRPYEISIVAPIRRMPDSLFDAAVQGEGATLSLEFDGLRWATPVYVSAVDAAGRFKSAAVMMERASNPILHTAELPLADGLEPRDYSGEMTLRFCSDAACASPFVTRQLPYRIQVFGEVDVGTNVAVDCCISSLALDRDANLYVADSQTIRKRTPGGVVSTLFSRDGAPDFPPPYTLGVDAAGNVWFSDSTAYWIGKIAPDGTTRRIEGYASLDMAFDNEYRYTIEHRRPVKRTLDGEVVSSWGPSFSVQGAGGITVDSNGVAYVAEERGVIRIEGSSATFLPPLPGNTTAWDVELAGEGSVLVAGGGGGLFRITTAGAVETILPKESDGFGRLVRTPEGKTYVLKAGRLLFTQLP